MKLTLAPANDRGFLRSNFEDFYGEECSLQKSSLATEDCIWLGVNGARMHLTQDMVKALIPHLNRFAKTGNL